MAGKTSKTNKNMLLILMTDGLVIGQANNLKIYTNNPLRQFSRLTL